MKYNPTFDLHSTPPLARLSFCLPFYGALGLALLALAISGCHLGKPASASFASVVIQHRSLAEIQAATEQVFRENGYAGHGTGTGQAVFEKEGSRGNTLSRDGLVAMQSGARTVVRVRAEVVDLEGGAHRLQCQAFMVSGAGDSFFEEEHRLADIRSGPYQKLLNEVAKRLK